MTENGEIEKLLEEVRDNLKKLNAKQKELEKLFKELSTAIDGARRFTDRTTETLDKIKASLGLGVLP